LRPAHPKTSLEKLEDFTHAKTAKPRMKALRFHLGLHFIPASAKAYIRDKLTLLDTGDGFNCLQLPGRPSRS
jgi:hypothetical protein